MHTWYYCYCGGYLAKWFALNRGQLHLLGKLTSHALRINYNTCRHQGIISSLLVSTSVNTLLLLYDAILISPQTKVSAATFGRLCTICHVWKCGWKCISQWMDNTVVAGAHCMKMKVKMSQGMGGDCSSLYEGWELEKASSGPWGAGQKRSIWDGE